MIHDVPVADNDLGRRYKRRSVKKLVFGVGALPQDLFLHGKMRFWCWDVAAGAFLGMEKNSFLVLERCRRRLFLVEQYVFGVGTLPQAPFLRGKTCFWCWNVAAGAFFS